MATYRTMSDVYSLVLPQQGAEEIDEGSEVLIENDRRLERLQAHGWVSDESRRTNEGYVTGVTQTGARIVNHWNETDNPVQELEDGVATYVSAALDRDFEVDNWEVVSEIDETIVLEGQDVNTGETVTRKYRMTEESGDMEDADPIPA